MEPADNPHSSARATLLTVLMLVDVSAVTLLFFVGLLGPFVLAFICIVGVLTILGACHYLLWGRAFSNQVMSEEDGERLADEADPWENDGPHGSSRF